MSLSPIRLLAAIALAFGFGAAETMQASVFSGFFVAPALADDDDDDDDDDGGDDDDDDDDDDDRGTRRWRRRRGDDDDDDDDDVITRPRPAVRRPPPPPEFVIAAPDAATLDAIVALGFTIIARDRVELIGADIARVRLPAGLSLEAARQQVASVSAPSLLDTNHLYQPEELTCGADSCMAFEMVGWRAQPVCSLTPTIGLIETGVNAEHASFAPGQVETIPVLGEGRRPASKVHGTAVALIIAGQRESRTPGILPNAKLVVAEAFHRAGGTENADVFDLVRAIEALATRDVDVINMSLSGPENLLLERAIAALEAQGVPVVAAAGNSGPHADPVYPAAYAHAVAVTAVDRRNGVYRQAGAGEHIDFAAPGVRMWTAASVSGGRMRSGTSYAAPFVASALAVMRKATPDISVPGMVEALAGKAIDLGEPGKDRVFGWGLVQMPPCSGIEVAQ